jgi:putative toxin-antitoxin system antitoxin component (TIGR02293 family)
VLSSQESERVERLARVYATALDVWGDEEDARRFLFAPHALLNEQKPIDMAFNELGARQVEQILEKLRYGLPV